MSYIRSAIFAVIYFCCTVTYGTLSLLLFLIPARQRHWIIITWTKLIIQVVRVVCGVRYNIQGQEHLDNINKPMVILSKHQSTWETLFLQYACFPAVTVLKQELLNIPFFGWGLRGLQPIAIDRSNPKLALKQVKTGATARIKDGYNILLFPEGTRMKPGERGRYARSGADIAIDAGVDILPVAVDAGYCWPGSSLLLKAGVVNVVFGPPISSQDKNSKKLIGEVEQWIESTMSTLTRE